MPYSSVLEFAADNPWIAFGLSFPTMAVLITASIMVASVLDNTWKTTLGLIAICVNNLTIIIRGHPPKKTVLDELLDGITEEKVEVDQEKEGK